MSTTYTTTPGTIPHRAAEILRALPEDQRERGLSSAQLAEQLGQPAGSIATILHTGRSWGFFRATKIDGLLFWSMGDGKPLPWRLDDEDRLPMVHRTVPAAEAAPLTIPVFAKAPTPAPRKAKPVAIAKLEPVVLNRPPVPPAPEPPPSPEPARQTPPFSDMLNAELQRLACVDRTPRTTAPLRLALWSDGALVIERDGNAVEYTPDETRLIVAYLERLVEPA